MSHDERLAGSSLQWSKGSQAASKLAAPTRRLHEGHRPKAMWAAAHLWQVPPGWEGAEEAHGSAGAGREGRTGVRWGDRGRATSLMSSDQLVLDALNSCRHDELC